MVADAATRAASLQLLEALSLGRATLLLGQRHSRAFLDELRRDLAVVVDAPEGDLLQILGTIDAKDAWENAHRVAAMRTAPESLLTLAANPWSIVITSAVDSAVHQAFQQTTAPSRPLRLVYAGHTGSLASRAGTRSVLIVRLFGALEEVDRTFRPPATPDDLRRRTRFDIPLILRDLPAIAGPRGRVVAIGIGTDDWLDLVDVGLACRELSPQTVHWFQPDDSPHSSDQLAEHLGQAGVIHETSFLELVEALSTSSPGRALAHARDELLHPVSKTITVGQGDSRQSFSLTPDEWRRVSTIVSLLDDSALERPATSTANAERSAFREFLRRPQRVPDWEGVARGYLFERERSSLLFDNVESTLRSLGSVLPAASARTTQEVPRATRLPLLVTGPPGCGKSRLLHWLTVRLRDRGHLALYVLPSGARGAYEQIERVCRLIEERTQSPIAVVADHLEPYEYEHLNEVLASSGRRVLLVGAVADLPSRYQRDVADFEDRMEPRASFRSFPLDPYLTPEEQERFGDYLDRHQFSDVTLSGHTFASPYFLLLLYYLLPDSRGNIRLSLLEEYERLLTRLDVAASTVEAEFPQTAWQHDLAALREELFGSKEPETDGQQRSSLWHNPDMRTAVHLALFCAQIERPLSLDLLMRSVGGRLLQSYPQFAAAVNDTALLFEVAIDGLGTMGLDAHHQFIADLALRTLVPDPADQLRLLTKLIDSVRWDSTARPGENSDQDYAIALLQAVGPRGIAEQKFNSQIALEVLTDLLAEIRLRHGANLPSLLLVEANALRHLANWSDATFDQSLERCQRAIAILDTAEQILAARRPSDSRNSQLQNVLTTRAVVHGFACGACLRAYDRAPLQQQVELRQMLEVSLERVRSDTTRARGLRASYFPLDVNFWSHRDLLEQLSDLGDDEKVRLVAQLETVLDVATEEPIEPSQVEKYTRRKVELLDIQGKVMVAESLARDMAARGDYSGVCLIARRKVIDSRTRRSRSPEAATEGLRELLLYGPAIFASSEALALMHKFWLSAHLSDQVIGGVDPVLAACTRDEWSEWRRIVEARLALPDNEANPYLNFCLAWVLLELGEPVRALQLLRANETIAAGNRRRVGNLAVITDENGAPIQYHGTVRRVDGQQVTVYIPALLNEVRVPGRVQAELDLAAHVGDEWFFALSLNYQGVLPWIAPRATVSR